MSDPWMLKGKIYMAYLVECGAEDCEVQDEVVSLQGRLRLDATAKTLTERGWFYSSTDGWLCPYHGRILRRPAQSGN